MLFGFLNKYHGYRSFGFGVHSRLCRPKYIGEPEFDVGSSWILIGIWTSKTSNGKDGKECSFQSTFSMLAPLLIKYGAIEG